MYGESYFYFSKSLVRQIGRIWRHFQTLNDLSQLYPIKYRSHIHKSNLITTLTNEIQNIYSYI